MKSNIIQYDVNTFLYSEWTDEKADKPFAEYGLQITGGFANPNYIIFEAEIQEVFGQGGQGNGDWLHFGTFIFKNNEDYHNKKTFPLEFVYKKDFFLNNIGFCMLNKLHDLYSKKTDNFPFIEDVLEDYYLTHFLYMFDKNIPRVEFSNSQFQDLLE
jgi:hypothetical protein